MRRRFNIFVLFVLIIALFSSCEQPSIKIEVQFLDGGQIIERAFYDFNVKREALNINLPQIQNKYGLNFCGWSFNNKIWKGTYATITDIPNNNIVRFETVWDELYTVLRFYCDELLSNFTYVNSESSIIHYTPTPKEGFEFKGWSLNNSKTPKLSINPAEIQYSENGHNFYAVWEPKSIEAIFYDGETVIKELVTSFDNPIAIPDLPECECFTFVGWRNKSTGELLPLSISELSLPYSEETYEFFAEWTSDSIGIDDDGSVYAIDKEISELNLKQEFNGKVTTTVKLEGFSNCKKLKSVILPNSTISIEAGAFYGCDSLEYLFIPQSVKSIGNLILKDCKDVTLKLENGLTPIDNIYCEGLTLDLSDCKYISSLYKENATYILLPDDVETLSFEWCRNLKEIIIPDSVTSIDNFAFHGCISLESITIPNSVTSIGWYAFDSCISLKSITIPDSVTSIEEWAFANCRSLKSIDIPSGVTSIGDLAFYGCKSLESITIPESLTSIGLDTFSGCYSLIKVYIDREKGSFNLLLKHFPAGATVYWRGEY